MKLQLTTDEVNQILNALAQQPYIQVHELINTIQQQGQQQLQQPAAGEPQAAQSTAMVAEELLAENTSNESE